jgi:ferrous iron transport protein A
MMPLTLAKTGEEASIKKVGGKEETRQFLANLGFVPGTHVSIVSELSGNLIVHIKESRVAISREMAAKIMI